jgi:glycosyltransferase involved in cell wall biosynthesis
MARVVILSGNTLCHNPRVIKEAAALADHGFKVTVLGAWSDALLKARDQALLLDCRFSFIPVLDLTPRTLAATLQRMGLRTRSKLAKLAFKASGRESRWQLGHAVSALAARAHDVDADLYIAHSEPALIVAAELLKARRRVGIDVEDWFSEDLMPDARGGRPLRMLRRLERTLLRGAAFSSCPSHAMSDALTAEFGCRSPTVIYNAFPWASRNSLDARTEDRRDRRIRSIHWYSQTLGRGRGLEDLFAALPHIKYEAEIHLRGKPMIGFDDWLASCVPGAWRNRIFVHSVVANDELLSRIAEHDIGFAGESRLCRSRDLTVTNKILHYMLAGLAVVASDTSGQREVAARAPGAIRIYPSGDPYALASELNALLASEKALDACKAAALAAAERGFCWERQIPLLMAGVEDALR